MLHSASDWLVPLTHTGEHIRVGSGYQVTTVRNDETQISVIVYLEA